MRFSAYSDTAIALAALLGFRPPANFNQPYRAAKPARILASLAYLAASRDLSSWAEHLSGPLAEQTQNFASIWDQAMATNGLGRPHDTLRSAVIHFLDCQWDNCP